MSFQHALVADDDDVGRAVIARALLAYGVKQVTTAACLAQAKSRLGGDIDLLLVSTLVGREACLPLLERVAELKFALPVIILGCAAPRALVFKLARIPVGLAYLEKPVSSRALWQCLDAQPDAAQGVARALPLACPDVEPILERYRDRQGLTSAEVEVLRCAARGLRRVEIAVQRGVTTNTLKSQVRGLLLKCTAPSLESLARRIQHELHAQNL